MILPTCLVVKNIFEILVKQKNYILVTKLSKILFEH